ncbi:MAG: lectin like domain-containing protein [Candidatus Aminicenantes bacterium]
MKKFKFGILLAAMLIAGTGSFTASGIFSGEEPVPRMAPLDEDFLKLQKDFGTAFLRQRTGEGYPLGLIPIPHDLSYFQDLPRVEIAGLPAQYNLRNRNKLTQVKNQGNCGSCWAFATYGSLESFLMPARNWDFSEQNLIQNHGFDYGPCAGGQILMSAAYLASWDGPANEIDHPYDHYSIDGAPVKKHVQEIMFIPPRSGPLDNDPIKNAVMKYGAVYTSMWWKSSCFNSPNNAYYNKNDEEGGHAVTIVGWNDNFSRNKFNTIPPGDGAFIVRNSWGKNWGDGGYFYVSYYDSYFGKKSYNAVVTAEDKTNYTDIYQYDDLGWVNSFGYGSDTAWFANIFTSRSNVPLTAVSFYTASTRNPYEIYIYKDVAAGRPRSGTPVLTQSGRIDTPGYVTVELNRSINLSRNKSFSVVVKLTTNGYKYPIPVEYPVSGYSSLARAGAGESFLSSNGSSWSDIHTAWSGSHAHTNVCLKAFTGYPPKKLTLTAGQGGTTDPSPGTHTYDLGTTVTVKAIPHNYYFFTNWSGNLSGSKNPDTVTMDSDKSVKAHFRLIHPPANVSGRQTLNRSLFQGEYINVLEWEANPNNSGINITKYRIYQMDGSQKNLLAELNADTYEYWHRDVDESTPHTYALAAVNAGGREGKPVYLTIQ